MHYLIINSSIDGGFMKSVQIKLKLAENVKSFVQKVAVFPGELKNAQTFLAFV